eukprot:scaffold1344_cov232-Alexandrium_tamarense.AAC.7
MSQLGCDNVLCLDSLQKAITIHRHTPSARPSFNDKQELQPTLRESPSLSQVSTLGIFKTMSMLYEVELAIRTLRSFCANGAHSVGYRSQATQSAPAGGVSSFFGETPTIQNDSAWRDQILDEMKGEMRCFYLKSIL